MIIRTSQDAQMVNCCPCAVIQCEEPRFEYEYKYASWDVCGWRYPIWRSIYGQVEHASFEWSDDVPCPDQVIHYRRVQVGNAVTPYRIVLADVEATYHPTTGAPFPNTVSGSSPGSTNAAPVDSYSAGNFLSSAFPGFLLGFSMPITMDDVVAIALGKLALESWAAALGPTYSYLAKHYATCDSVVTEWPSWAEANQARYRVGIPSGFTRSVYELQWDEVFFPAEWDAWNLTQIGPEPTPGPSIVAPQSWTYISGGDEFSGWFEPATPAEEGQVRPVNMMVKCYHASSIGVKPTSHGEIYSFPE